MNAQNFLTPVVGSGTAPQNGAHAGKQLPGGKRLGHIVVGSKLKRDYAVRFVVVRGKDDDRNTALHADAAQDLHSGHVGKHHVQKHQIVAFSAESGKTFLPAHAVIERYVLKFHVVLDQETELLVVIYQKQSAVLLFAHGNVPLKYLVRTPGYRPAPKASHRHSPLSIIPS